MNKRQLFRCAKYGIMIMAVLATSSGFCPGQEAGNRGNTMPASAIWRQFFSGQFSPEMMQWYVQQNRPNTSTSTTALQRDLQKQRNRIEQQSFAPVDRSYSRTRSTSVRNQPRTTNPVSSTNNPEYLNMLGRLEFSLDKLGQKPNDILAPPSSSSVMARFISGRKTPEMTEWKQRYTELANMRRSMPSPASDVTPESMIAAQKMPQMTRPDPISVEQERQSLTDHVVQVEPVRTPGLSTKPEGYDSIASVRLVSGVVPENEMPANYSVTHPNRSETESAPDAQKQLTSQPEYESETPGKMKVYRPREDTVRVEASRPASQSPIIKTPAPPKPLVIVPEENEWNPVPVQ